MLLSRHRTLAVALVLASSVLVVVAPAAATEGDGDELGDVAIPPDAPPSPPTLGEGDEPGEGAIPSVQPPPSPTVQRQAESSLLVDDFVYDDLVLEGTAAEVCFGRLRDGAAWTYNEIVNRFGGSPGTLYYCRERWDVATNPDCNGQLIDPVTNPTFSSTCWSNHARGRAIDVMVGRSSGGGYNVARGRNIVNWLLATDSNGNPNAVARRLGIQQILFNNRCWNSDGDRGIPNLDAMRECGIGHFDHVHLDLTEAGSEGAVSYWGHVPRIAPKGNGMFLSAASGRWHVLDWVNRRGAVTNQGTWSAVYDEVIAGDWDRDGEVDDTFAWDRDSGVWVVLTWNGWRPSERVRGRWSPNYDEIVAADLDGEGLMNDMFLRDADTGAWTVVSWSGFRPTTRMRGSWARVWDQIVQGDFNGDADSDGVANDLFVWDGDTGNWTVISWHGFRPTGHGSGTWSRAYDQFIVGDFSAGGDLNDVFVRDRQTGSWRLLAFLDYRPTNVINGTWRTSLTDAFVGDWDTDGRYDDLVVRDRASGAWQMLSWHRGRGRSVLSGTWSTPYVRYVVGSWS